MDLEHPERYLIAVRSGKPVLFFITEDGDVPTLVPAEQDHDDETLLRMVEAQGGRFRPGGLFRFDPILAASGIRNCPWCGSLWFSRVEDPVKCPTCQRRLDR